MRLADCLEAYQYNSGQVSSNVRQLGFAALASVWLFKSTSKGETVTLPLLLWWVGGLSVAALFFDFVQYLWNATAWGQYHRRQELKGIAVNEEFLAPTWINWPGNGLFVLKVCCLFLCYFLLLVFLWGNIQSL